MGPSPDVAIDAERIEAAVTRAGCEPRLECHAEQRRDPTVRMTHASDPRAIDDGERGQIVDRPAKVRDHLPEQRPAGMRGVERDRIAVMTGDWIVTLAKAQRVPCQRHEPTVHQLGRRSLFGITCQPHGLTLAFLCGLVRTQHRGHRCRPAYRGFWHEQIRRIHSPVLALKRRRRRTCEPASVSSMVSA